MLQHWHETGALAAQAACRLPQAVARWKGSAGPARGWHT